MTYFLRLSTCRLIFISLGIIFLMGAGENMVQAQTPALTIRQGLPGNNEAETQIAYGNGSYLACVAAPVRFFTSADGVNWSRIAGPPVDSGTAADLIQNPLFAYGAGEWVVVSNGGKIYSSPDLVTWTRSVTGTTQTFEDVEYVNDTYWAVGDSATFLTSADGLNWTPQNTGLGSGAENFYRFAGGNGVLAIASNNLDPNGGSMVVYVSNNGLAGPWTSDTVSTGNFLIRFVKGRFYAFGAQTAVSTDAKTWTAPGGGMTALDAFSDSGHVYMVGPNQAGTGGVLYTSNDGINFGAPINVTASGSFGAYLNGRYYIYGLLLGAVTSTDAVNFHTLGSYRQTVASNGSVFVKVSATPNEGHIYSSTDFNTWTPRDTIASGLTSLLYDTTRFLAEGDTSYSSVDGESWLASGSGGLPYGQFLRFVYGGGNYVAYYENDPSDFVWYSKDGISWNRSNLPTQPVPPKSSVNPNLVGHICNIRYVNGRFWLLSSDINDQPAMAYVSTDGTDFSEPGLANVWQNSFQVSSYSDMLYDVDSAKYYFFGVGAVGGAMPTFFSVSTANPFDSTITLTNTSVINGIPSGTPVTDGLGLGISGTYTPTNQGGYHFTYSHGHFIGSVVGPSPGVNTNIGPYDSWLIWSSDGFNWNSQSLNGFTKIISTVASGDTFRMEGLYNYEVLANFSDPGVTLLVSLLDFNAVAQNNNSALLTWETASQENSRAFVIQRSSDTSGWANIGSVAAAGNSSSTLDYSFTDRSPSVGYDNYRLLLTDVDGSSQYSPVRRVWIGPAQNWLVFPNPAKDHVTIEGAGALTGTVTLYDGGGRAMQVQVVSGSAASFSLEALPSGVYYIVVVQADGTRYQQQILHTKE